MSTTTGIQKASDKTHLCIGQNLEACFLDRACIDSSNEVVLLIDSITEMPLNCCLLGANHKFMASEPSGVAIFNRDKKEGWEIFTIEFSESNLCHSAPDRLLQSPFRLKDCHSNYVFNGDLLLFGSGSSFLSLAERICGSQRDSVHQIRLSRQAALDYVSKAEIKKLEIGSGPRRGINGWTTLDASAGCDLRWDLRHGLPFDENTLDVIYSSHVLEHIPYKGLRSLLVDCLRALKPGGSFTVCVPSVKKYIDAYIDGRSIMGAGAGYQPAVCDTGSLIDQLNYTCYMDGEHKYMFDEENLVNLLRISGFSNARTREFNAEVDMEVRRWESIYAIAEKPL